VLNQSQRTTILELHAQGVSKREIARTLKISRLSVRKVLRANSAAVPPLLRPEKAEPYRQQILELLDSCKGNLVRVREELEARGVSLAYSTLTAFCHRHGIGQQPVLPSGNYDFLPGEEMQHDTSPHEVELGGQRRKVQTASAVLCYSRMLFFQMYPTFTRFDAKVFLTDALCYFGGVVAHVVIDNMWWCCAAPAAKWCPFPRWLLLPSASASASWLTSSEMRTVRLASNAPFGLSSGTSWPGAASSTGGI
jgi:transposase